MNIGIDAHNLEMGYGGASYSYLKNLLFEWDKQKNARNKFILYFKNKVPEEINKLNFEKKISKASLSAKSNAFFQHITLPLSAREDNLDVFWGPYYLLPMFGFRAGKRAVTIHDICYEAHPQWFSWQDKILLKFMSKQSAKKADIVITDSEFSKQEIISRYRISESKVKVIQLAASDRFRRMGGNFSSLNHKFGIRGKFILYVGSIFNRRHVGEVLEAFYKIGLEFPDFQFLIIGKNSTYPYVDFKSRIKGINKTLSREAVIMGENVSEENLALLYNSSFFSIWLSDCEGFGLPVLESMSCGTPVITNKAGSLSEVGENAVLYVDNPSNVREIYEAMRLLITDSELYNDLGEKGLKRSMDFSWKKCAQATLNVLTQNN